MRPQEAVELITIFLIETLHLDGHLSLVVPNDLFRSQLPWGSNIDSFMCIIIIIIVTQGELFSDNRFSDISYGIDLSSEWECPAVYIFYNYSVL